jgi:glutamyl-tRNA reductase
VSLIVVGLNHRTAPVTLLERMTVPEELLTKVLHDLSAREHLLEVVVLSTCNRIEVYARCTHFHPAVAHLFAVAAGLDSMIVGESEILGQVREAWQAAVREGTAPQLAGLFRHAVESGKRVRTETGIGRHPVSIPSAAVSVAAEHLGTFEGAKVLVIGAGQMATGLASTLRSRGVEHVWIANRTLERAQEAAERIGAQAIPLSEIADTLVDADVMLSSTASTQVLVERATVEMVMACRGGKPLLVVDVALPRDIDPGVREINDVTLLDLDDLKDYARRSAEKRRGEIGKVREILAAEIERYRADRSSREVAPLVTSLHDLGEDVRVREIERFKARLEQLDPDQRAVVEALTQGIVNKLLHEPTVRVKDAAGTPRGEYYADALAALFDLPSSED